MDNYKSGFGFRNIFISLVIAFLAGAVTFAFVGDNSNKYKPVDDAKVKIVPIVNRKTVPALDMSSYSGQPLSIEAGQITVLNFWASWCAPCRQETPMLVQIANDYPDVKFIGLTNDDTKEEAQSFAEEFGISYQIGNGNEYISELASVQPIYGLPTTLIIDRNGQIAAKVIGGITDSEFRQALSKLLAE